MMDNSYIKEKYIYYNIKLSFLTRELFIIYLLILFYKLDTLIDLIIFFLSLFSKKVNISLNSSSFPLKK